MTVPRLSIIFMGISCAFSFLMPLGLFIYFRRKKADILPFFTGIAVMILFAFVLEQQAHALILGSSAGQVIQNNLLLYALYGGIMAGLFEETGRYIAFRTVLKGRQGKDINALMYGAGHGGFEAAFLLGTAMINNIAYSLMLNSGRAASLLETMPAESAAQVQQVLSTLVSAPSWQFLIGGIERVFALILHLCLSVLVWFAVKNRKPELYAGAVFLHFLTDAAAVILAGAGMPQMVTEAVIGVLALAGAVIAKSVWKSERASTN